MGKHSILLAGGERISSGSTGRAIQNVTVTQAVNSGEELVLGSVCAAMVELTLMDTDGQSPLTAGEEFSLYREVGGEDVLLGIFIGEKPTRQGKNRFSLTAYDRVSLLDKKLDSFIRGLDQWPYTLSDFVGLVCGACGVTMAAQTLPQGEFLVEKFTPVEVTGRQLLSWAGQVMGRFCRATPQGEIRFDWYTPCASQIGLGVPYFAGSLSCAGYATHPIDGVQIGKDSEDVGIVYPAEGGENLYPIYGNPLLLGAEEAALTAVAQGLFAQLSAFSYTPCSVTVSADAPIEVGELVTVTDGEGNGYVCPVMTKISSNGRATLQATGSARRDSPTAVNAQSLGSLAGKVLHLKTEVSGIYAENRDTEGRLARLQLTVDGLGAEVSRQNGASEAMRTELTRLEQSANAVSVQVEAIRQEGTQRVATTAGYTFDNEGLHIRKSGEEMENRLDHTGMYVQRGGDVILSANAGGVVATDVAVRNYLIVGNHARFEDYEGGTGCFFL